MPARWIWNVRRGLNRAEVLDRRFAARHETLQRIDAGPFRLEQIEQLARRNADDLADAQTVFFQFGLPFNIDDVQIGRGPQFPIEIIIADRPFEKGEIEHDSIRTRFCAAYRFASANDVGDAGRVGRQPPSQPKEDASTRASPRGRRTAETVVSGQWNQGPVVRGRLFTDP